MTKNEILEQLPNLDAKQKQVVNRLFWAAEKRGSKNKLADAASAEEALAIINATFRNKRTEESAPEQKQVINLAALSIEELEKLLSEIPAIIDQKKAEQLAEIDRQIEELKAMKKELSK